MRWKKGGGSNRLATVLLIIRVEEELPLYESLVMKHCAQRSEIIEISTKKHPEIDF